MRICSWSAGRCLPLLPVVAAALLASHLAVAPVLAAAPALSQITETGSISGRSPTTTTFGIS